MMTREESASIPPQTIIDHFRRAFVCIYGRDPAVRYMGNHWYVVDGETVHRKTLMIETHQLEEMASARAVEMVRITNEMVRHVDPTYSPAPIVEELRYATAGAGGGGYVQDHVTTRAPKVEKGVLQRLIARLRNL